MKRPAGRVKYGLIAVIILFVSQANAAIYFTRASGNWNNPSTWSTAGYGGAAAASFPGAAAGDVVLLSGVTVTVTASTPFAITSMTISQNYNTGNNTKLVLATAATTLTCNSVSMIDNNRSDDVSIEVSNGTLQINGSCSITRSATNTQDELLQLYVWNNGRMNITGSLTYTYGRAKSNTENDNEIILEDNGRLDVTGNFTINHGNTNGDDNHFTFEMNDNSICNIGGNVSATISNSDDGDDLYFDLNGGTLSVTGTFTATVAASSTTSNTIATQIDGASMSTGNFNYIQSGGGGGDMSILMNKNSTARAALLTVNGAITFTHNAGDNMEIETNANSTLTSTGDLTMTLASSADGDNLYLDLNGGTVSVDDLTVSFASGASSSNFFYGEFDGATLNVAGNVSVAQSGGGGNGDINFWLNASSTANATAVNVSGNMYFHHNGGDNYEIELNNNSAMTINGSLTDTLISNDGDDYVIDVNGGTLTVRQNFNHVQTTSGGTTEDLNIRIDGSGIFNVDGNVNIDHSVGGQVIVYLNNGAGSTAQMNTGGNFYLNHLAAADGVYLETNQSSAFTVDGNFTINNNAGGGDNARIRLYNSSTFTVSGNMVLNLLSGSSAVTDRCEVDINGGTLTVAGDMTLYSTSGENNFITLDGTCTLDVRGTLTLQNAGGNLMYVYQGNGSGSPTVLAGSLIMNDTGGGQTRFRLYNSSTLTVTNNITLTALAATQIDIALYSTSRLRIGGSFIRSATPNRFGILSSASAATVEYNGTAPQTIAGDAGSGGDAFAYGNVILNNTGAAAPQFSMTTAEGNATIPSSSSLTFTDGIVASVSSAFFVISNNATVSGASDNSHVDGPIRKVGTQAFTFPVGDNGNYQPAGISAPSNATHHFTAQYIAVDPDGSYDDLSKDATLNHISSCEYWNIERTFGASSVTVTLFWDAGSCGVDDLPAMRVAQWDGTVWRDRGQGGTTGTPAAGSVYSSAAITTFPTPAPFTLASSNGNNPLPVELVSFEVKPENSKARLNWVTASEKDNDYFDIERSGDGINFMKIGQVKGSGNSNVTLNYMWYDLKPLQSLSYYRLKQVDFNGNFEYSRIQSCVFNGKKEGNSFTLYPNPNSDHKVYIRFNSEQEEKKMSVDIFDLNGVKVYSNVIAELDNSSRNGLLKTPQDLPKGVYIVSLHNSDSIEKQLLVIN
jgi:Secretion system C-terminal sorting domain